MLPDVPADSASQMFLLSYGQVYKSFILLLYCAALESRSDCLFVCFWFFCFQFLVSNLYTRTQPDRSAVNTQKKKSLRDSKSGQSEGRMLKCFVDILFLENEGGGME